MPTKVYAVYYVGTIMDWSFDFLKLLSTRQKLSIIQMIIVITITKFAKNKLQIPVFAPQFHMELIYPKWNNSLLIPASCAITLKCDFK